MGIKLPNINIDMKNISNFHTQEEDLCDGFDISSWEVSLYDNFCIFNLPKLASSLLRGWNSSNNNLLCANTRLINFQQSYYQSKSKETTIRQNFVSQLEQKSTRLTC